MSEGAIVESGRGASAAWRRLLASRYLLGGLFALATALTALSAFLATAPPQGELIGPASRTVLALLGFNLVLILTIAVLIGRRVAKVIDTGTGDAGARLHRRFLLLFALAAVAPALLVAAFSGALVTQGIEAWFSQRVQTVVEKSADVARAYVEEQSDSIQNDMGLMAADLNEAAGSIRTQPIAFAHYMATQAAYRRFPAAYVIDGDGRILARAEVDDPPPFLAPPASSYQIAAEEIALRPFESDDLFRALYRLKQFDEEAYLYVVRPVNRGILSHLRETEASLIEYRDAARQRGLVQTVYALSFLETALLVLIAAIWLATTVANSIAVPIARVVQAAGQVASGHLEARVEIGSKEPEDITVLSRAFNSMAGDLQAQQSALTAASLDAESRRMFIETVLLGVSAGVLGVDRDGTISAANRQAARLLDVDADAIRGAKLADAAPELAQVWAAALEARVEAETEVDVVRHGETLRLRVRAGVAGDDGVVLTFDDITRLITAQRNAAWKDVARRIAHEIKNPLTPIQLSAERLRRKYRHEIKGDLETFDRCTDTIIRQVGDIGRMVDEFSAFARMPTPRFGTHDPAELLRQTVFAQRVASPDIAVEMDEPPAGLALTCDDRMLSQALANVLKNAAEAIAGRAGGERGRILARLHSDDQALCFVIEDNGVGLPARDRDRLTEPYVTTREKGTGLGLAIVKRILEEHGGELLLSDAQVLSGARVTLKFPPVAAAKTVAPTKKNRKVTDGV